MIIGDGQPDQLLVVSTGPAIHDVAPDFSLEELLDENPLFSSENGRLSIVSRVNTLPKFSGHKIEVKDPQVIKAVQDSLAEKKSPDEIIDEILKAGFYQHSKIFQNKIFKKFKNFQGQEKLISRENHKILRSLKISNIHENSINL